MAIPAHNLIHRGFVHFIKTLLIGSFLPLSVVAQKAPARPALPDGSDANDPAVYYRYAAAVLEENPAKAEQSYYWAARLAPGSADALYGLYISRLLADKRLLVRWMEADERSMRAKELVAVDSLRLTFSNADPFIFGIHDRLMIMAYLNELVDSDMRRSGINTFAADRSAINYELENYLRRMGPGMNGWLAYLDRNFAQSLSFYDAALKGARDRASVHSSRALVLYHARRYPEAVTALKTAVEERAKQQKNKLVHMYESQASYEYMMGRAYEAMVDVPNAREAYSRALLSELSYYPAHVRLGNLALVSGDTTTALNSFKTAVDLQSSNGWVRSVYGNTLLAAGKLDEAEAELKQATVLEPYFAAPYYALGRVHELKGDKPAAVSWYKQFLERASRFNSQRGSAEARVRELGS